MSSARYPSQRTRDERESQGPTRANEKATAASKIRNTKNLLDKINATMLVLTICIFDGFTGIRAENDTNGGGPHGEADRHRGLGVMACRHHHYMGLTSFVWYR